jgi:peptidylprolyl isomerase
MVIVLVALVLALTATSGSGDKTTTSTTAVAEVASAKGKPCVAMSDPVPNGAPSVPVQTGPPPTTLVKKDLKIGTGAVVPAGGKVQVNYIGVTCSTGKIFDSSYGRKPLTADLKGGMIAGWVNGLPGMKVGGRRLLGIPSGDAYGPDGYGASIKPDESLWFVVDAIALKK